MAGTGKEGGAVVKSGAVATGDEGFNIPGGGGDSRPGGSASGPGSLCPKEAGLPDGCIYKTDCSSPGVTRPPGATYRIQFNREFPFLEAQKLAPYLSSLGITDLYASPLLEARRDSPHGYDVINPGRLNPELGGMTAFASLSGTLKQHRLGLLLDIVPNHMAADGENPWWQDVLRLGRDSPYSSFFDIDWQPARPGLQGKVLLPILGSPYGKTLENGELKISVTIEGLHLLFQGGHYPLSPSSTCTLLRQWSDSLAADVGDPWVKSLMEALAGVLEALPAPNNRRYYSSFRQAWGLFWQLYSKYPGFKTFIQGQLQSLNGRQGEPASFRFLDQVLGGQAYRLAYWKTGLEEINYRRFFDVAGLVSLRVEDEGVLEKVHGLIFDLVQKGRITGLRIDHIDGLRDPYAYLCHLQKRLSREDRSFYVVVEKILTGHEVLPPDWPVSGTTGYDFLNLLNGLFVDGKGTEGLRAACAQLGETTGEFGELVYRQKKRVLMSLFPGEMRTLAWHLGSLAEQDRYGRDLTLGGLERALVEVTACLPVYRTYICSCRVSVRERRIIERTVAAAKKRLPDGAFALDFLRRVILLEFPDTLPVAQRQKWLDFVRSWQLYTGPAMAKGFEDTALYLYNRLISLNEVGGNPACEGVTVAEFHRANEGRQKRHPHTLNATSTHDTKRGEDVRARINVLSELSGVWSVLVRRWSSWNLPRKPVVDGLPVPDPAGEMLIYQTLVGAWPLQEEDFPSFRDRLETYSVKAAREAKLHTSWLNPREAYERALREFISAILESSPGNPFLLDFLEFQRTCAYFGALNALSQVLLKIASPGVPDFYQGTELWSFSLVDPDNRRPVDFRKRVSLLDSLQKEEAGGRADLARKLLANWKDGRVKLYLTYKALHLRRSLGRLFENGVYVPVGVAGARCGHVCAFIRRLENNWVLAAAPRLVARLMAAGLELEPGNKKTNGPLFPYLTGEGTMQPVTRGSRKLSPCQPAPAADRDLETKLTGGPVPDVLLPPVRLWEDTTLLLPEQAPDRWLNIFTDEEITIVRGGTGAIPPGCKTLPLARLLASFPVALLIPVRSGTSS